jgi:hypothetical protein
LVKTFRFCGLRLPPQRLQNIPSGVTNFSIHALQNGSLRSMSSLQSKQTGGKNKSSIFVINKCPTVMFL